MGSVRMNTYFKFEPLPNKQKRLHLECAMAFTPVGGEQWVSFLLCKPDHPKLFHAATHLDGYNHPHILNVCRILVTFFDFVLFPFSRTLTST